MLVVARWRWSSACWATWSTTRCHTPAGGRVAIETAKRLAASAWRCATPAKASRRATWPRPNRPLAEQRASATHRAAPPAGWGWLSRAAIAQLHGSTLEAGQPARGRHAGELPAAGGASGDRRPKDAAGTPCRRAGSRWRAGRAGAGPGWAAKRQRAARTACRLGFGEHRHRPSAIVRSALARESRPPAPPPRRRAVARRHRERWQLCGLARSSQDGPCGDGGWRRAESQLSPRWKQHAGAMAPTRLGATRRRSPRAYRRPCRLRPAMARRWTSGEDALRARGCRQLHRDGTRDAPGAHAAVLVRGGTAGPAPFGLVPRNDHRPSQARPVPLTRWPKRAPLQRHSRPVSLYRTWTPRYAGHSPVSQSVPTI